MAGTDQYDFHREPKLLTNSERDAEWRQGVEDALTSLGNALLAQSEVLARLDQSNKTMMVNGSTSTRWDSPGVPLVWVFTPPQPYADTTIVCAPDSSEGINARCYAQRKVPGGGQIRWPLILGEPEEIS